MLPLRPTRRPRTGVLSGRGVGLALCGTILLALARPAPAAALGAVRGYVDSVRLTPTTATVAGWALRSGSATQLGVRVYLDGALAGTGVANSARPDVARALGVGAYHGIRLTLPRRVPAGAHRVCVTAAGVPIGCRSAVTQVPPGPVSALSATPGDTLGTVVVRWQPPTAVGTSPVTAYVVSTVPTTPAVTVASAARTATLTGLVAGTTYSVRVAARSAAGTGPAAAATVTPPAPAPPPPPPTAPAPSPSPLPLQTTPAPVSTSHYLRQLTGASTDLAAMRALGAYDAPFNPSGHRYTALLDIGGQVESQGGVMLSATTRFVTYAHLVAAIEAYLDGYASTQRAAAPMVVAVCTNNDLEVSSAAGRSWMLQVIAPLRAYAARFPQVQVVGADDIEPGFSGGVTASRAWLSGYLAAGSAPFVFNGSADGCSPSATGSACNNGWRAADLAWLAGGAAPSRISVLPQVYNTTMARQWAQISATGAVAGPPLSFAGPLTEWTACDQAGTCSSLTGVSAWNSLWSALRAIPAIAPAELPTATDLDIH